MQERKRIIEDLRKGIIKILFISPEKLITDRFINLVKTLPPIAFACVDEAHCISEWSHNFRTSYLRVNAILREKLKVETILALTATATKRTEEEICLRLQIQNQAVIRISSLRSNLHATISCDEDK